MKRFAYGRAHTVDEALRALSGDCWPLAGGTDLVALMKKGLVAPERLVNLKAIPALHGIEKMEDGWRIGALTTLSQLVRDDGVSQGMEVLSQAALESASPQLRHVATIAGNLLQRPRCWYFRNPSTRCWLKGGDHCFAAVGKNAYHAVFGARTCHIVHPSDPAVALLALGAEVEIASLDGRRRVTMEGFFPQPRPGRRSETVVGADELVTGVYVPSQPAGSLGIYVKIAERAAWDFALVSVALQASMDRDIVEQIRVVLGGVASRPWRAREAEEALKNSPLTGETMDRAATAASVGVAPLSDNGYKVPLLEGAVREALRRLSLAVDA